MARGEVSVERRTWGGAMTEIQVSMDKINTIDNNGVPLSMNRSPSSSFERLSEGCGEVSVERRTWGEAMTEIKVSMDKINTIDNNGVPLSMDRSPSSSFERLS